MNALHRIHAALVPGGLVLDMQPVGPRTPVVANGRQLGTLDMREWRGVVDEVAALVDDAVVGALFAEENGRHYEVVETFEDGNEFVETVREWTGTKISRRLSLQARCAAPPLKIYETVRLRVLRTV